MPTSTPDRPEKVGRLQSLRKATASSVRKSAFAGGGAPLERAREFLVPIEPSKETTDVVLAPDTARSLLDIVDEYRHADAIRRHHIPLRTKLLFCGPPGCGKSLTAEVLAKEVGLPLLAVKLDTVIGSLFGETASNLRQVFEAAERQSMVLFLDEFDALARTRSDPNEHSEMRRVVNNLLLLIERFDGRGFIVAATNLEATIDPAITRRFDAVISFQGPGPQEIRRLIRLKTTNFPADIDIPAFAGQLAGKSYADIERICFTAMRRAVIDRRKRLTDSDFQYAMSAEQRRTRADHSLMSEL